MMTTINACTSAVLVWIWFMFVCFFIHFLLKKKKRTLIWKMSLFGVFVCFCNDYNKRFLFFSYFHWCDFRKMFYICSFPVSFFFRGGEPFLFFLEAVSFVGPWEVHKGEELLPYLTSRRCWKQRLKKRTDTKEARRDLFMGRTTTLGNVLSDNSQSSTQTNKQKKNASRKLCLRLVFFPYLTREQSRRTLYSAVKRERLWVVVTVWSHNSRKSGKGCVILQYLQN